MVSTVATDELWGKLRAVHMCVVGLAGPEASCQAESKPTFRKFQQFLNQP